MSDKKPTVGHAGWSPDFVGGVKTIKLQGGDKIIVADARIPEWEAKIKALESQRDALLKAAKEALPWVEQLHGYVEDEWGRVEGCSWSTEKLKAKQAIDNLRAAVAGAEGKQ